MMIVSILILLVSICCPFLIFLDYNKRGKIHVSVIYVSVFFLFIFLASKLIYHYGMVLAGMAPLLILLMCLIKKKR